MLFTAFVLLLVGEKTAHHVACSYLTCCTRSIAWQVADQATELDKMRIERTTLSNELTECKIQNVKLEAQLTECKSKLQESDVQVKSEPFLLKKRRLCFRVQFNAWLDSLQNASMNGKLETLQLAADTKERDLNYKVGSALPPNPLKH